VAKPQVRLDPDVAQALERLRGDRSLSHVANAKLRQLLGLPAPGTAHDEHAEPQAANAVVRAPTGPVLGRSFGRGGWQGPARQR
jgi:hypothetical protein